MVFNFRVKLDYSEFVAFILNYSILYTVYKILDVNARLNEVVGESIQHGVWHSVGVQDKC